VKRNLLLVLVLLIGIPACQDLDPTRPPDRLDVPHANATLTDGLDLLYEQTLDSWSYRQYVMWAGDFVTVPAGDNFVVLTDELWDLTHVALLGEPAPGDTLIGPFTLYVLDDVDEGGHYYPRHTFTLPVAGSAYFGYGASRYLLELPAGGITLEEGTYWLAVVNEDFHWIGQSGVENNAMHRFWDDWTLRVTMTNTAMGFSLYGSVRSPGPSLWSQCQAMAHKKNGANIVTVSWSDADPGVTMIRVTGELDGKSFTSDRKIKPSASGSWSTEVQGNVVTYGLWGGAHTKYTDVVLVEEGAACARQ
jgi:hypothetical protein